MWGRGGTFCPLANLQIKGRNSVRKVPIMTRIKHNPRQLRVTNMLKIMKSE